MTRPNRTLVFTTFFTLAVVSAAVLVSMSDADPPPGQACLQTPFRGITETSELGELIGFVDPLDWGCVGGDAGGSARTLGVPVPPPPSGICLHPPGPNPSTGAVRLRLTLGEARHVSLVMHGQAMRGGPREVFPVRTLLDADLQVGEYEVIWDAKNDAGERVPPGIYRAVMEAGADALCGDIEIR